MNFDACVAKYNGTVINDYSGECVALIAHYCLDNNKPIAYANAKDWFNHPSLVGAFDFITNNPTDYNQVPLRGDVIIWDGNLAGSGGYGHIAIYDAKVSSGVFRSLDNNWGGRYVHFVTHNYNNVIGWFRPKTVAQPQGDSMNDSEITQEYLVNRGKAPSAGELASWRNGSFKALSLGFKAENDNYRKSVADQLKVIQEQVNIQNTAITHLSSQLKLTETAKAKLIAEIADANAQITTARDTIKDLENTKSADTLLLNEGKGLFSWIIRLIERIKKT